MAGLLRWSAVLVLVGVGGILRAADQVGPPPLPRVVGAAPALPAAVSSRAPTKLYDSGDPTADEQYVLEIVNRARANPTAEGQRLQIDIKEGLTAADAAQVGPKPPLAMNKILLQVAREHSQDMYARAYFDHYTPEQKSPFDRMTAAGYDYTTAGENIATSSGGTAAYLEDLLMVDENYPERGHRTNLLDLGIAYREVGVGYYSGATRNAQGYKDYLTQDFGTSNVGPFLVGVVYDDKNGNKFYDIGEGLSSVTVKPDSGTYYAVTSTSGGFAFPVATSGTLQVTFSGGGLPATITKTVTLGTSNVKLDATVSDATGDGGDGGGGGDESGGGGDESGGGGDSAFVSQSMTDTDSDGFEDEIETFMGYSATDPNQTPYGTDPAGAAVPLPISKLALKLNFAKGGSDSLQLAGTFNLPDGFVVEGRTVLIDAGGIITLAALDSKGSSAKGEPYTFKLRVKSKKGVVSAQTAPFTFKISRANLASFLTDEGFLGTTSGAFSVDLPVIVFFYGQKYMTTQPMTHKVRAGKSGSAK